MIKLFYGGFGVGYLQDLFEWQVIMRGCGEVDLSYVGDGRVEADNAVIIRITVKINVVVPRL